MASTARDKPSATTLKAVAVRRQALPQQASGDTLPPRLRLAHVSQVAPQHTQAPTMALGVSRAAAMARSIPAYECRRACG